MKRLVRKNIQRLLSGARKIEKDGTSLEHWHIIADNCLVLTEESASGEEISVWEPKDEKFSSDHLSTKEFTILRTKGTERPFSSIYDKFFPGKGYFACRACGLPLYSAASKFNSGTGWPSFGEHVKGNIIPKDDYSLRVKRVELCCRRCRSHLGHVFAECNNQRLRPLKSFRERQCINGVCLRYIQEKLPEGSDSHATALLHPGSS